MGMGGANGKGVSQEEPEGAKRTPSTRDGRPPTSLIVQLFVILLVLAAVLLGLRALSVTAHLESDEKERARLSQAREVRVRGKAATWKGATWHPSAWGRDAPWRGFTDAAWYRPWPGANKTSAPPLDASAGSSHGPADVSAAAAAELSAALDEVSAGPGGAIAAPGDVSQIPPQMVEGGGRIDLAGRAASQDVVAAVKNRERDPSPPEIKGEGTDSKLDLSSPQDGEIKATGVRRGRKRRKKCRFSKKGLSKLPPWLPRPGKYFLAWCHLYGSTNRLYCHEKALIIAALLNRTAIIPSIDTCVESPKGNTMDLMIDVAHIRECAMGKNLGIQENLGVAVKEGKAHTLLDAHVQVAKRHGVGLWAVSLEEYLTLHEVRQLKVDVLMCEGMEWYGACPPAACNAAGYVVYPNRTEPPVFVFNGSVPLTMRRLRVLARRSASADVLSFGDTFYGNVKKFIMEERSSLAPMFGTSCGNLFQPTPDIFSLAQDFIKTTLNSSTFGALHFRRKDFESYCGGNLICPFWSVEQAADCIGRKMVKEGLKVLFVASDAYADELRTLIALLKSDGVELFMFLPETRRSWFESALVEKVIAAHAEIFMHQEKSTFSYHILQLRDGMGTGSCADVSLCQGWKTGFIASSLKNDTAKA